MKLFRVWWIPQVPMEPFYYDVKTPEEGQLITDVLDKYDIFQFENNVKPDYANTGGIEEWDEKEQEWVDWEEYEC